MPILRVGFCSESGEIRSFEKKEDHMAVVLLVGYLGIDSLKSMFDDRVMKVAVCSQEKPDQLCKGKENIFIWTDGRITDGLQT